MPLRVPAILAITLLAAVAADATKGAPTAFPGKTGRIAYNAAASGVGVWISTISPDGTRIRRVLTTRADAFSPSWSADGRRIVSGQLDLPCERRGSPDVRAAKTTRVPSGDHAGDSGSTTFPRVTRVSRLPSTPNCVALTGNTGARTVESRAEGRHRAEVAACDTKSRRPRRRTKGARGCEPRVANTIAANIETCPGKRHALAPKH